MKTLFLIISIIALVIFLGGWLDIFPDIKSNIYYPFCFVMLLLLTSGGLSGKNSLLFWKIIFVIMAITIIVSIYWMLTGGLIGAPIFWYVVGLLCAAIYMAFLLSELFQKLKTHLVTKC